MPYATSFAFRRREIGVELLKKNRVWLLLATIKPAKNQVILSNGAAAMTGNSRVIEESEGYPRV